MGRPEWASTGIGTDRPNVARMYDYYLGGSHNLAVDREMAEQAIAALPDLPRLAQANRAFLRRAVRYCAELGLRQFLDIGSGIPTAGNVHEIAQRTDPQARVAYVDIDPIAVAHAHAILAGDDRAGAIQGDVRQPGAILDHPQVRRLLDLDRPVVLLLVTVLHFVSDAEGPAELLARLLAPLATGSHLVLSHGTTEELAAGWRPVREMYQRRSAVAATPRSRTEIEGYFAGLELVDPGVVWTPQWRPDDPRDIDEPAAWSSTLAGVARKP